MADYIVTSGELTTVANAIRAKNGTSSNLSWPDGFVSGISSGSGGGGGSSDFSTAEVAIVNNDEVTRDFYLPIIDNINEPHASFGTIQVQQGNTNVTAILYENLCGCSILGGGTVTVTGNATVIRPTMVAISGDCTITIS